MDEDEPVSKEPAARCSGCGAEMRGPQAGSLGVCMKCWTHVGMGAAAALAEERKAAVVFGRYEIAGRGMRGGMGTVYRAVDTTDGRIVALKVINPEHSNDPIFRERFRRETTALETLEHRHIVRLLSHGEAEGMMYLVMEWIGGGDLRHQLKEGPLPVLRALEVFRQTAEALMEAHARGVVHRDIKPGNLLLDESGAVKVADFGLVQMHGHEGNTLTADGLLGGAHYSAPELLRGSGANERTDIFSLGVLLYHLLTGHPPQGRYLPARKVCAGEGITRGLDAIMDKAMAADPHHRFAGAAEMAAAVARETERMGMSPWRRNRRTLALTPLVFAMVLGGTWGWRKYGEAKEQAVVQSLATELQSRLKPVPPGWQPERWENSLGMPFVSIPECGVMFCQWETRVQDFAAYWDDKASIPWRRETGFVFAIERATASLRKGEFKEYGDTWRKPGFETSGDHAVCGVNFFDAQGFCTWLTWQERKSGKITAEQAYRLPTDEEWSAAAGLAPEPGATPEARWKSWPAKVFAWSWGTAWPAPDDTVNVAGNEVLGADWSPRWIFKPRHDPWPRTAPVNSGLQSSLGLYHLSGNVSELTESEFEGGRTGPVIRGGSWFSASQEGQSLNFRDSDFPYIRNTTRGFRIVFQRSGAGGWRYGGERVSE